MSGGLSKRMWSPHNLKFREGIEQIMEPYPYMFVFVNSVKQITNGRKND
jgi:hypothetical protein